MYDRLLFDTDFSFYSYMDALRETGFKVLEPGLVRTPGPQLFLPVTMAADGSDPDERNASRAIRRLP